MKMILGTPIPLHSTRPQSSLPPPAPHWPLFWEAWTPSYFECSTRIPIIAATISSTALDKTK